MYINKMVESQNDSGAIVNETISKVINFKKLRLKRNTEVEPTVITDLDMY